MAFESHRKDYRREPLTLDDLDPDPIVQFGRWLEEAVRADLSEPSAMTLATVDADGRPSARTVLLRGLDERGFVFFTNLGSRKARDVRANPRASLVFRWQEHVRQVTVTGTVEQVAEQEADAYFATRPRDSQISAWASPQSQVIGGRAELEQRAADVAATYEGTTVPRPPHWSGFRVLPAEIEFWQGRPARLHDRIRYRPDTVAAAGEGTWVRERLGP
jgi:pyridoxamine 5'-phosphate oxidase